MAVLKVPQSEIKVRESNVAPTGSLALPMSIATQQGQAFGSVGKVIENIYKEQRAIEDQNEVLEAIKKATIDIEGISSSVSKNSDLKFAVDTFDDLTKPEKFQPYIEGKNRRVKKIFNEWLNKTRTKEYASIAKTVTKNHVDRTKLTNNDYLDGLTIKMASSKLNDAQAARDDFDSFFKKPETIRFYSAEELEKLKQDKKIQAEKYIVLFGAKNHPQYVINNYKEIEDKIGIQGAMEAMEIAKQKIVSDTDFEIKQEEWVQKRDEDNKIATFTEIALRIKNDDDPEYLGKIPTLDLLNDLHKSNKINSAQYEALLRLYNDPKAPSDEAVFNEITAQIYVADTVEDIDRIQRVVNLTPEYLLKLGIKDVETINGIIEKAKDRQSFQDAKFYRNIIDTTLGKVEQTILRSFGPSEQTDQTNRNSANRLFDEYLQEGLSPEEAFQKVSNGFLKRKDKLPTIYNFPVASINIKPPSKTEIDQDPNQIFQGWRKQVYEQYRNNKITINDLKRDLSSLDTMEDIFKIRAEFKDNNFGFADNNIGGPSADAGR